MVLKKLRLICVAPNQVDKGAAILSLVVQTDRRDVVRWQTRFAAGGQLSLAFMKMQSPMKRIRLRRDPLYEIALFNTSSLITMI